MRGLTPSAAPISFAVIPFGDKVTVFGYTVPLQIAAYYDEAGQIFDVAPEAVTAAQREVGKTVNFATIYGQGATALGHNLGISRAEAKRHIDRYFVAYAGVRAWLDRTVAEAHQRGFVTTLLGRRRYIPELSSQNQTDRAYGERVAANTPIQGSAADLIKLAMVDLCRALKEKKLESKLIMQIHDELVFEVINDEAPALINLLRDKMENVYPLAVPIKVNIKKGINWLEMEPCN